MKGKMRFWNLALIIAVMALVSACASAPPQPSEIVAPQPIMSNCGAYMCPYTQDDVVAEWVDKGVNASMGAGIGKVAGAYAGSKALEQVPFVGGFLGAKVGEKIGREIAVKTCGGWDFIKSSSDMSFDSLEDLSLWMYVHKSSNEHYNEVVKAVSGIYPKYQQSFAVALKNAERK